MFKKGILLLLFFTTSVTQAQEKFDFKNDPKVKLSNERLMKFLPKKIFDKPEFQLRLWFAIKPFDGIHDNSGLLLISYKNKKWQANKISFNDITRKYKKKRAITSMRIDIMPLQPFDIENQFNQLKTEGLFTCRSLDETEIIRLAKQRGYDTKKGYPIVHDGFGFSVELITAKAKRSFTGRYPDFFYNSTDKLVNELVPLIKIQKRLFNIAGVGLGL
ncbi:hypothetical protein [Pedobacter sp. UBA5917]|jgi:hypothetical protein|uniref:hypothetical protein n=1 Tax=Pedobacter sp. UBA5917 TaxID=1947061 RepID=UPI0026015A64|nr:hypothetical protein [Pedobacter sp. UBA5917]